MIRFIRLAYWRSFLVIQVTVMTPVLIAGTLVYAALSAMVGALVAFPFAYAILQTEPGTNPWKNAIYIPFMIAGAIVGAAGWIDRSGAASFFGRWRGDSHGSARFAGKKELRDLELANGLLIGRNPDTGKLLSYDGPAHLLTLAPTRAGKGVGTVIPNLLIAERSVLVIDPKGENERIAGAPRERFRTGHVLDPFGVSSRPSVAYNPLDRLSADSPDLSEDATSLADALVVDPAHQTGDAHWNEEAKAPIGGLIMFCVAHEEPTRRNLGAVREYLILVPGALRPGKPMNQRMSHHD